MRPADFDWDHYYVGMAKYVAVPSKDPSTQTGAVFTRGKRFVSAGYNGFPQAMLDKPEAYANREYKYRHIIHCERNALIFAERSLVGCTLYTWPFMSCSVCASMMIQAGIVRHVAPFMPEEKILRWKDDMDEAMTKFAECGVVVDLINFTEGKFSV